MKTKIGKNELVITCMRIEDSIAKEYIEGLEGFCIECDHKVWLSDSTVAAVKVQYPDIEIDRAGLKVMCIQCTLKQLEENGGNIIPPSRDQLKDVVKARNKMKGKD